MHVRVVCVAVSLADRSTVYYAVKRTVEEGLDDRVDEGVGRLALSLLEQLPARAADHLRWRDCG